MNGMFDCDEAANQKVQEEYINFLRGMFKGTEPTKIYTVSIFNRYSTNKERKNTVSTE